jgi:hypothetical protein
MKPAALAAFERRAKMLMLGMSPSYEQAGPAQILIVRKIEQMIRTQALTFVPPL